MKANSGYAELDGDVIFFHFDFRSGPHDKGHGRINVSYVAIHYDRNIEISQYVSDGIVLVDSHHFLLKGR